MCYRKVLVVSHNCFSKSNSNGRTIGEMFEGWDKDKLSQIYIIRDQNDIEVCTDYFNITDEDACKSLFSASKIYGKRFRCENNDMKIGETREKGERKRTLGHSMLCKRVLLRAARYVKKHSYSISWIIRNTVWKGGVLAKTKGEFWSYVDEYSPDVVFLVAGGYEFSIKLARKISERKKVPLIIFNTEEYYFYFRENQKGILRNYIKHCFMKEFELTMKVAARAVYNTTYLKERYDAIFKENSSVLMTTTSMQRKPINTSLGSANMKIVYLGNVDSVMRYIPLIELAQVLQEIDKSLYLNVYGVCNDVNVLEKLNECEGIFYHGVVSYKEVCRIIHKSDLLIHVENKECFVDKKYIAAAFSTKIADYLASGVPFLLYAPENCSCTQYLLAENAAHVVTKSVCLKGALKAIIEDRNEREKYVDCALKVAERNHNKRRNHEKLVQIINDVCF